MLIHEALWKIPTILWAPQWILTHLKFTIILFHQIDLIKYIFMSFNSSRIVSIYVWSFFVRLNPSHFIAIAVFSKSMLLCFCCVRFFRNCYSQDKKMLLIFKFYFVCWIGGKKNLKLGRALLSIMSKAEHTVKTFVCQENLWKLKNVWQFGGEICYIYDRKEIKYSKYINHYHKTENYHVWAKSMKKTTREEIEISSKHKLMLSHM